MGTRAYSRYRPGTGVLWLLLHGRGAACAMPSCVGAYVSGAAGSNECPAGSVRIETEAACRTAAATTGKIPASTFMGTSSIYPRGCYHNSTSYNVAFFNAHAVGAGRSGYQLLCGAVTTGAPFSRRCATRVCCAVLGGGASNNANGLNIDTHAYIRMYVYTHMCTYDSDGAPRGRRRTGVQGRGTLRVLEGYSKGTQPRVLKQGHSQQRRKCFGCLRPYSSEMGGQCSAVLCALGVWQYISGTQRVLKGYS